MNATYLHARKQLMRLKLLHHGRFNPLVKYRKGPPSVQQPADKPPADAKHDVADKLDDEDVKDEAKDEAKEKTDNSFSDAPTQLCPRPTSPSAATLPSLPAPEPRQGPVWDYSVSVPLSRQNKLIYPKAPVEHGPWSQEECRERFLFVKNELAALVDKYLDLEGLERCPVYASRMVGTSPSTARPSIVITCRDTDVKKLQDLFRSKARDKLFVGRESTLAQLRSSFQRAQADLIPRFQIVYFTTRTATVIRRASGEPLQVHLQKGGEYCGGAIRFLDASATLGLSIDIDDLTATLTVDHLFSSDEPVVSFLADVHERELSSSEASPTSTFSDGESDSIDALWEDDDDFDHSGVDDMDSESGKTERLFGTTAKEKLDVASPAPEIWEKMVPPERLHRSAPYLDWALTRPSPQEPRSSFRANRVFLNGPEAPSVYLEKVRRRRPEHLAPVSMVSAVRGVVHGQILSESSFLPSLPGQDHCEAWYVILESPDGPDALLGGESGSIIVDRETNEVYGHVIGCDPLGHAYVTRLTHVLGQVKACFGAAHVGLARPRPAKDYRIVTQESKKRFVLSEMIKQSDVDVDVLAEFVRSNAIESAGWSSIELPSGLSIPQCVEIADSILAKDATRPDLPRGGLTLFRGNQMIGRTSLKPPTTTGPETRLSSSPLGLPHTAKTEPDLKPTLTLASPGHKQLHQGLTVTELLRHQYLLENRSLTRTSKDDETEEQINQLQTKLAGRDYLFFIDDIRSMAERGQLEHLMDGLQALSFLVKNPGRNGIQLVFSSKAAEKISLDSSSTTSLIEAVRKHEFTEPATKLESRFGQLIRSHVLPRLHGESSMNLDGRRLNKPKPLSVFVLTNGAWRRGSDAVFSIRNTIEVLDARLRERMLSRNLVTFQFIQFGHSHDGAKNLRELIVTLPEELRTRHIVSSHKITDDVTAMFRGSIGPSTDGDAVKDGASTMGETSTSVQLPQFNFRKI